RLVLDDPRLTAVREAADREAYSQAAQALAASLSAVPPPTPEDARAWLYQLGRLRSLANDPAGAADAFEKAAQTPWPLADYAAFQAAQSLVKAGKYDA